MSISRTKSPVVSRRCEGAILIVDAAQGVEAQTLANAYLAIDNDLEIIPLSIKLTYPPHNPMKPDGR